MNTVREHYDRVLADVYSWMFGGIEGGIQKNREFFKKHNISPTGSGIAIDLGAGCGFQSRPRVAVRRTAKLHNGKGMLDYSSSSNRL